MIWIAVASAVLAFGSAQTHDLFNCGLCFGISLTTFCVDLLEQAKASAAKKGRPK